MKYGLNKERLCILYPHRVTNISRLSHKAVNQAKKPFATRVILLSDRTFMWAYIT